jgi:UDP-GlcNAc:undecaprenyl-phosphate/decaprenyl-phosphate GlcNAc-1-phosphate transferase
MYINFNMIEIIGAFGALAISFVILINAEPLGTRLGVIDYPDHVRKLHARATPLIGGIAMMVPLLSWALLGFVWPGFVETGRVPTAMIVCGGAAALIGFLDDRSPAPPVARLMALLILTYIALLLTPELRPTHFNWGHLATTPVTPWLADVLVAIGMAGYVNAVNMADGQDGCVTGMFVIWAACVILAGGGTTADTAAVLLLTGLAVLVFNLKGKVFLGGTGTYGVTFVFGLLVLGLHNRWGVTGETVIVWFFVPIVDCLRLMITRPLQGRSPFEGDRNHFHHRLHDRFGKNTGLAIYLGLVASTSVVAALAPQFAPDCLITLTTLYFGLMWVTVPSRVAVEATPPD